MGLFFEDPHNGNEFKDFDCFGIDISFILTRGWVCSGVLYQ